MPAKPSPKPTRVVCEVCGLSWEAHGAKPTLETCIGLLRAELAKRPKPQIAFTGSSGGYTIPLWQG
jgi:hypothetical protein